MTAKNLLTITLLTSISIGSASAQLKKRAAIRKSNHDAKRVEISAAREEFRNDLKDTHGSQAEVGKDIRPSEFSVYHKRTIERISALLRAGKITEEHGTEFKLAYTEITTLIKEAKETDKLTSGRQAALRDDLDELNDAISAVVMEGDEDSKRTPILNKRQNRYEEMIEFGERSGRLSTGEASGLRRDVERLAKLEERLKNGAELSTREREKLHEEMLEVQKELRKEITD